MNPDSGPSPAPGAAPAAVPAPEPEAVEAMRAPILDKLTYAVGKDPASASDRDWFIATALAVRDRIVDRWMDVDARDLRATAASGSTTSRSSS